LTALGLALTEAFETALVGSDSSSKVLAVQSAASKANRIGRPGAHCPTYSNGCTRCPRRAPNTYRRLT
jgi:hypothetical protein